MQTDRWDELTKEEKASFLGDNSIHTIGGRDTEVTQLAMSVGQLVKDYYPINGVPASIAQQTVLVMTRAVEFENAFTALLELIAEDALGCRARRRQTAENLTNPTAVRDAR